MPIIIQTVNLCDVVEALEDHLVQVDLLVVGHGLEPCLLNESLRLPDRALDWVVVGAVGSVEDPFELQLLHHTLDLC